MAGNKFDFNTANRLVELVAGVVDTLDVKNGQMEHRFGALREVFKDDGYDRYSKDMKKADEAIGEVLNQMKKVGAAIATYAVKLRDEA